MPKSTKEPHSTIEYHPYRRDPTGDVILNSIDGVQFRASSYRLCMISTVFAGMLEVTRADGDRRSSEIIEMSYSSEVIHTFLDLASSWRPASNPTNFHTVAQLRELVGVYNCTKLSTRVDFVFDTARTKAPFSAIIYASNRNDVELARKAMAAVCKTSQPPVYSLIINTPRDISSVPYQGSKRDATQNKAELSAPTKKRNAKRCGPVARDLDTFWYFMDALRPTWQHALLRLVLKSKPGENIQVNDNWSDFAENFNP